jgi:transcriptional antiterminator
MCLCIVGRLIGRSSIVNEEKIYDAMLAINSTNNKITIKNLALHFACSTRTIHRHMSSVLKKEKKILNEEI